MQDISSHTLIKMLGKSELSLQWRTFRKGVLELPKVQWHGPGKAKGYRFSESGIDVSIECRSICFKKDEY